LVAWHYDAKGVFSVKSAYHVLDDKKEFLAVRQRGESSRSDSAGSRNFKWKKIWKLPILPKVNQFVWRLVHNSLPVKKNIQRRLGPIDTLCPVYKRFDEDGGHCFLKCKLMRRCWLELGPNFLREELLELRSSREMVTKIISLEEKTCILVLNLLWKWCSTSNAVNAGEKMLATSNITCAVRQITNEGSRKTKLCAGTAVPMRQRWTPPPQDLLKINVDEDGCLGLCGA
jgi:hypothetical protein